jgi:hypothetical protein
MAEVELRQLNLVWQMVAPSQLLQQRRQRPATHLLAGTTELQM